MSVIDNFLQECFNALSLNMIDTTETNFEMQKNPYFYIEICINPEEGPISKNDKIDATGIPRLGKFGLIEGGNYWNNRASQIIPRWASGAFTLNENKGIITCGKNLETTDWLSSVEAYNSIPDVWTNRTDYMLMIFHQNGISMTKDMGIVSCGLDRNGIIVGNTTSLYESTNSWVGRASNPVPRYASCSFGYSNDIALICGGSNSTYLGEIRHYTFSSNVWSLSNTSLSIPRRGISGFSIWGGGVIAGGENGTSVFGITEAYYHPTITCFTRSSLVRSRQYSTGLSFDSFYGMVAGGSNSTSSSFNTVEGFLYDENSWITRTDLSRYRSYASGLSLRSDIGIITSGDPNYQTERYNNGCYRSKFILSVALSTYRLWPLTSPDPSDKPIYFTTKQLRNQTTPIYNVLANCIFTKTYSKDPTYGISLDDGETWKDDIKLGTICNTKGLLPSKDGKYKLRVRFKISNEPVQPIVNGTPPHIIISTSNKYTTFLGFFVTDFNGAKIDD